MAGATFPGGGLGGGPLTGPLRLSRRTSERGFTLIELILALSIVAALLAIAFGGLRVGLAAWRQGEDRAEIHQHARSLTQILGRALAGTHAYRGEAEEGRPPTILFEGSAERVAFITVSPPFPAARPIAFTAVTFSLESGTAPGLAVRQKVLPNKDPFEAVEPAFVDPAVTAVRFRYLSESGDWTDRWEAAGEEGVPKAIEIMLTTTLGSRGVETAPFIVSIWAGAP